MSGVPRKATKRKRNSGEATIGKVHTIYLCDGFSEAEKATLCSGCPSDFHFLEKLSTDVTHVVLKGVSSVPKPAQWLPLYYCAVSNAWLLLPTWITESKKQKKAMDERGFLFDNTLDCSFAPRDDPSFTFKDMLDLIRSMSGHRVTLFQSNVYKNIYILSGRSKDSLKRKNDLKCIFEAGGGHMAPDDSWKQLKAKKPSYLPSIVLLLNGTKREDHNLDEELIKKILLRRIPILFEECIIKFIRLKLEPDQSSLLFQSLDFWRSEVKLKLKMSASEEESIIQGTESAIQGNISQPKTTSSADDGSQAASMTSLVEKAMDISLDSSVSLSMDGEEDLLAEFNREVEEHQEKSKEEKVYVEENPSFDRSVETAKIEEEIQTVPKCPLSVQQDVGARVAEPCGDPDKFLSSYLRAVSWVDVVSPSCSVLFPPMVDPPRDDLSSELIQLFNLTFDELENNDEHSLAHDIIAADCVSLVECDLNPRLVPPVTVLSKMFFLIAKRNFGDQFDSPSMVLRLLRCLLRWNPPCSLVQRLFWLRVFSRNLQTELLPFRNSHDNFRALLVDVFMEGDCLLELQEFLVFFLETDLYYLKSNDDEDISICHEMGSRIRGKLTDTDLDAFPLALVFLYNAGEKRKRGLDMNASETMKELLHRIVKHTNPEQASVLSRFACVVLESLRWYLSSELKMFPSDSLSIDMRQAVGALSLVLQGEGISTGQMHTVLPLDWIMHCVHTEFS